MDSIGSLLKFTPQVENKHIHSDIHFLADEISTYFGEKRLFRMYLGVIKRFGVSNARALFKEIQETKGKTAGKLFIFLTKQRRIEPCEPKKNYS